MNIFIPPKYNKEDSRQIWFIEFENHPIITDCINGFILGVLIFGPIALVMPNPI